ncbi:hypothetical protein D3C87_2137540 [compost metagenome]
MQILLKLHFYRHEIYFGTVGKTKEYGYVLQMIMQVGKTMQHLDQCKELPGTVWQLYKSL